MKDKVFEVLQRVGRSFMLPIALLPVAGLFLGIGGSFTNETMLENYGLVKFMGEGTVIYDILTVMNAAGNIIFVNLPILFAIGIAIGMAKQEKAVAALAATIAFFVMHSAISALIDINGGAENMLSGSTADVVGITSLQIGVFGGIIVGLGTALLHNKFYKIKLPQVISFFGGTRFVPIVCAIAYLFAGIILFFVWQPIQAVIYSIGDLVFKSGYIGTWIYGIMERALIPFGLHHVFYLPFWQTALGGTQVVDGNLIEGAQNIFFAELASKNTTHFSVDATRFMAGKFPFMIFGLTGAALAMYNTAKESKKKTVGGLLISAALTSMITGITEPLEFTFLFVAPLLYGVHCVLAGLSYMLMHVFNVGVGMTFSGGLIDLFLFGVLQGNAKTNWLNIIWIGIIYFLAYYFIFSFMIKKFNYKTPGREEGENESKLYTKEDYNKKKKDKNNNSDDGKSSLILKGLGGRDNISDLDCCATRLRVTVRNAVKVDEDILKSTGAAGVIKKGNGVQVVYGPNVSVIKSNLDIYMENYVEEKDSSESNNKFTIYSPLKGKALELKDIEDGVFSEKMMGEGIAVEPEKGVVKAPCDGSVEMIFDTKHAIGIKAENGIEILIHIGIDTVTLNGDGFNIFVNVGDKIKKGDLLAKFDIEKIQSKGLKTITPITINSENINNLEIYTNRNVDFDDKIIEIS